MSDEPAQPTTLQLARKIADAVAIALMPRGMGPNRNPDDTRDAPTQAVMRVLDDNRSWICRVDDGVFPDDDEPATEQRKLPL